MTRTRWIAAAALGALAVTGCARSGGSSSGGPFADVEITPVDLGDGVYMLVGAGGNIGLSVGDDGVLMIDDQFAPLSDKIEAKVEELSRGDGVRFIVNTHLHGDHTGGNENFAAMGATIVAHDNVRARLSSPSVAASGATTPARPASAWPILTFANSVTFHMNGQTVHVIHVPPAHTDGDSIIWFEEANVIHLGDTVSWNSYPRVDALANGSLDGFITAATTALALADDDTRFMCGHGTAVPLTKADLEAYREMVRTARDILEPLTARPEDIEEIVAADPLASLNERWGHGSYAPEDFVRSIVTPPTP